ncbi:G-type lectin S-receptor-like serine/threonine-protein kinase At4g03230 [Bidens hawaiensis]|uniref:G-type lectin S-receptor-like serine/threonine-protein kinase At4g03230 n=1 Tax=Bidens hawaiensis TaxID=980011 RepID=UPI00404A61F9
MLWQSFDNPTDTFLPGMKMGTDMKLTSWKGATDPGSGSFQFQPEQDSTRYSILNGPATYYWKSAKSSTNSFDDNQIFSTAFNLLSNTPPQKRNIILPNRTTSSETVPVVYPNSRLVMDRSGKLQYFIWLERTRQWNLEWQEPKDQCSIYKVCGPFGMCSGNNGSCSCLPGYEPISPDNHSDGCKRTTKICDGKETFINRALISMDDPTLPIFNTNNESKCIEACLKNCTCVAYSYSSQNKGGIWDSSRVSTEGCWFWETEPNNLRGGAHNISFRFSEGTFSGTQLVAQIACSMHFS